MRLCLFLLKAWPFWCFFVFLCLYLHRDSKPTLIPFPATLWQKCVCVDGVEREEGGECLVEDLTTVFL